MAIVGFLYLANFFLFCPILILNTNRISTYLNGSQQELSCFPTDIHTFYIIMLISAINTITIPFVIMLFCSILIIYSIYETRKKQATQPPNKQQQLNRDIHLSMTIVTIDIIFLIFNTPQLIEQSFFMLGSFNNTDRRILNLLNMFYFLQYSVNFFIYMLVYLRFRKVFFHLFLNI